MIQLRGITWDHPRGHQPLVACSATYAERFGVGVEWERRSLQAFGDLPIDRLAQEYDLLIIDHPHVGLAARTNCLTPMESLLPAATLASLAATSAGPSHASYTYAGSQWALAVDAAMQVSACRPDFASGQFPATWDEVISRAGQLRKQGQWMATPLCPTDAICSFMTLCANLGAPVGQEWVDRAVGRQALELLSALCAASHPQSLQWNPIALLDQMAEQAEIVYCPLTFCYSNYARSGFRASLLQFGPIPHVHGSLLGGAGIAVSAYSAHREVACKFSAWLCSEAVQSGIYVQNGGQPGSRPAWLDAQANELTHGFFRDTLPALDGAYVRPRHEGFVPFQEQGGHVVNAYLRDGQDAQACLAALEQLFWRSSPA